MQIGGRFEMQLPGSFGCNSVAAFEYNSAAAFMQLRMKMGSATDSARNPLCAVPEIHDLITAEGSHSSASPRSCRYR